MKITKKRKTERAGAVKPECKQLSRQTFGKLSMKLSPGKLPLPLARGCIPWTEKFRRQTPRRNSPLPQGK